MSLLIGKFCQIFMELSARDSPIFSFPDDNLSKFKGILTKLGTCIDIKEVWFGIALGVVGWCEGAVYLTSLGCPADIGLQLGKACYPCSG